MTLYDDSVVVVVPQHQFWNKKQFSKSINMHTAVNGHDHSHRMFSRTNLINGFVRMRLAMSVSRAAHSRTAVKNII